MRRAHAFLLICSSVLAACASGTTTARPVPTTPPTATLARQPVVLAVSATSEGTVAANTVLLDTKVAITNNTDEPIQLTYTGCNTSVVELKLFDPSGIEGWQNYPPKARRAPTHSHKMSTPSHRTRPTSGAAIS